MRRKFLILPIILFIVLGCSKKDYLVEESRLMMGTVVKVKAPTKAAITEAFSKMEEIERLVESFDERAGDEIALNPKMAYLLRKASELRRITGGAFDITVSPLVELWSSYAKDQEKIPDQEEIAAALSKMGSEKGDFSGIAKGFAVDEAIGALREGGVGSGLVDAGGDIYCLGFGPGKKPWRVGVKDPRGDGMIGTLLLEDKAVATSGDYQKFFIVNGIRYSHIVDPRSGYPVGDNPMSATIVAPDCITADGLATAIMVMGPVRGLELVEGLDGVEAVVVSEDRGRLRIDRSSGLEDIYEGL